MTITIDNQAIIATLFFLGLTASLISVLLSAVAIIKVVAMEKSTHTMQYVSTDEYTKKFTQEENTAHEELYSNQEPEWATTSATIAEQNKKYQEELKDQGFDFFLPEDDDKKKYSF